MESDVAAAPANPDIVDNVHQNGFDIRMKLNKTVQSEWAKTSSNVLEKKKNKRKSGKGSKKKGSANVRNFQSLDMLNDCVLEDHMVVDEKSEIIKNNRKIKIDIFTNGYEKIMDAKGH